MKRVIAYVRCSTEKNQDNGERQIQQIRTYCKSMGFDFLEEETIRENISGAVVVRSGLTELLSLSKADCDIVVVSESSRLTRSDDITDLLIIVKKIQTLGLDLIVLGSNDNKIYPADKKLTDIQAITLIIEASANAKERLAIQQRLKTGKQKKAVLGGFTGHKVAFGYRIEPNLAEGKESEKVKGFYAINEEEAAIIYSMFDLVANHGYSASQVSKHLTSVTGNKFFTPVTCKRLKNPIYKGTLNIHGATISVPAIVTPELFDKVQSKLSENFLLISRGSKNYNPLKGIAKCACGCSIYINANGKDKTNVDRYLFYKCESKNNGNLKESCKNDGISSGFLNKIVWSTVKSSINVEDFKAKTAQNRANIEAEIKGKHRQITLLEKEKSELETKANNTTNLLINTINSNIIPSLEKALSDIITETKAVENNITQVTKELKKLDRKLADLEASLLTSIVENSTEEEKHEVFKKYISKVTYYSINQNRGFVVISFINGVETIVLTKTRPNFEAFQLPQNCSFNPETRKVINSFAEFDTEYTFSIPRTITKELDYYEVENTYNLNEFEIDLGI